MIFVFELMKNSTTCQAESWLDNPKCTLGEYSRRKSKAILKKLIDLGCRNLIACDVESDSDGSMNTGVLVAEIPSDNDLRKSVLKYSHHLVSEHGFQGNPDDGQKYLMLKFD